MPIFTSLFQEVWSRLSSCIKGIYKNAVKYKNQSADDTAFTELLEWLGWVYGETEEFPGLLWLNLSWPLDSRWIVYGPENAYNFPYPIF